jgi:hypothetical protein
MSLKSVGATFACDECGTSFTVDIDAAYKPPEGWCVMDIAEDAVRAGMASAYGGDHFCDACTAKHDRKTPELEYLGIPNSLRRPG